MGGGELDAAGTPEEVAQVGSYTGRFLRGALPVAAAAAWDTRPRMRLAAGAVLVSVVSLCVALSAGAGSIRYRAIQAGSSFLVSGTPLACVTGRVKGSIALSCLDRNPKTNDVYRESVGASMIAGRAAHVVIIGYTKDGKEFSLWRHDQPPGPIPRRHVQGV
jgi:hypothetical protein